MANVVRVGVPPDIHLRKYVDRVNIAKRICRSTDRIRTLCGKLRVILRIEFLELFINDDACLFMRRVLRINNAQTFSFYERQGAVNQGLRG